MKASHLATLAAVTSVVVVTTVTAQASGKVHVAKRAAAAAPPTRYTVATTGNEARYRVREQLAGIDFPNDAVGATHDISGTLVLDRTGAVVADSSRITVNLTGLKSDKARRDGFLQRRVLETDKYPTAELSLKGLSGFAAKPPFANPASFDAVGGLTVHGVTHPTTWKIIAHSEGADVVGTATTAFTFKDVGLEQPRVPVVLSVADTIKLEYDFRFTPVKDVR